MAEPLEDRTKALFESLARLYKQGQMLLMDTDRLMREHGWEPMHTSGPAELSNSLNSPERWYARWAGRFYAPGGAEESQEAIDRIAFVGIHFASDHDTKVEFPLVSAGWLLYHQPMSAVVARQSYFYWMCKYWFYGQAHDTLEDWRQTGQSRWVENQKGTEAFAVPLYSITSSARLKELVVDRLLAADRSVGEELQV